MAATMTMTGPTGPPTDQTRQRRDLSFAQRRVEKWIKENHGVLSEIARELSVSVQYVHRAAYDRNETPSRGMRIEKALKSRGCPIIQKIQ